MPLVQLVNKLPLAMIPMIKLNGTNETTLNVASVREIFVLFWCFLPVMTEHFHLGYYILSLLTLIYIYIVLI